MEGLELHFHWLINSLFLETNLLANFRSKELVKVSLTELFVFLFPESQFYKMESRPRGFCLIFNNMSFKDKNLDRLGANFDEQKLCDLFKKLQFKVCLCKDVDKHEMEQICTHLGSKDHSQYDAFVCIIMSHGTSGDKIMGVDGRTIGIVFQPCTVNEVFLSSNN